jgi:hypothetical protein
MYTTYQRNRKTRKPRTGTESRSLVTTSTNEFRQVMKRIHFFRIRTSFVGQIGHGRAKLLLSRNVEPGFAVTGNNARSVTRYSSLVTYYVLRFTFYCPERYNGV